MVDGDTPEEINKSARKEKKQDEVKDERAMLD